ncbi:MAG: beta-propeller domain-containing protein, partial [Rhodopirellula sp. JB055]|uniref:beta-propeller domain-containing protein n=1 Tax=Rhodopirellula sp. JB055 TaxID=3342846 RepID=UPI003709E334
MTVDWNADDKIVIVKDDNQEIMLEVGNRAVLNNGAVEYLDCSVLSRDSRTFIPLRYISESFGYSVRWDGKTNSVHISKEPGSITGQEEDTSVLPTVNDIESLYQLLRYNDNMSYYLKDDDVRITPGIIDEDVQYEANGDASYDRPAGSASTQESNKSSDYSGTNNQVGGIEEADLIKTDGRYLYIVRDREITIANADPADLKVISKVDCDSGVSEIYIYEDKLVIINGNSRFEYLQGNAGERYILDLLFNGAFVRSTNVKVYDIENRAKPVLISDNDYEGRYLSSRMIDDDVYIVANAAVQLNVGYYDDGEAMIFGADSRERFLKEVKRYPADELEMYLELTGLNSAEELYDACRNVFEMNAAPKHTDNIKGKTTVIDLKDVYYFKDMIRPNYMMTIGLDLNGGNKDINAYLGSTGEMYVSAD